MNNKMAYDYNFSLLATELKTYAWFGVSVFVPYVIALLVFLYTHPAAFEVMQSS